MHNYGNRHSCANAHKSVASAAKAAVHRQAPTTQAHKAVLKVLLDPQKAQCVVRHRHTQPYPAQALREDFPLLGLTSFKTSGVFAKLGEECAWQDL